MNFEKRRQRLRMLYKYWKIGKWHVVEDTVTDEEKVLLQKYYGIDDV